MATLCQITLFYETRCIFLRCQEYLKKQIWGSGVGFTREKTGRCSGQGRAGINVLINILYFIEQR